MKFSIKSFMLFIIITQLFSCVIINPGNLNTRNAPLISPQDNAESVETLLARFPLIADANWVSSSLHLTVINPRKKTVAEIYYTGDTANYLNGGNSLLFKLDVRDFDKTTVLSTDINCPWNLINSLNFTKAEDGFYKITSKETDSTSSCLIKGTVTPVDKTEILYSYSGQLINEYGTEVGYRGQGDPPALKIVYAALVIASGASENMHYVVDICNTANTIENAKRNAPCKDPKIKIEYFPRPLTKIFYKPIYPDFYRDCRALVICPKK